MLSSTHKMGGRGFSVAVWVTGLMALVELVATYALFERVVGASDWAEVTTTFMLAMGGVGGIYQAQNIAERLPGRREFNGVTYTPEEK